MAAEVAWRLRLDRVLWVPAGAPPHKPRAPLSTSELRLAMVRAAIQGRPGFEVATLELERPGPSYTVDTVRELAELHPELELFVIVGADQYEAFRTWKEPDTILDHATLVVMDRAGEAASAPVPPDASGRIVRVDVDRVDISSSEVRERVGRGEAIDDLVPPGVRSIIESAGLYREGAGA